MSHPNGYPKKTFVPYEGDMPAKTVETPVNFDPSHEGIAGVSPEERYYVDLLMAESIDEAAALGPEPVFNSLAEAAAVQPDLIALVEDYEVRIVKEEN
ncbi:MAG TPA: hypothetical protein VFP32_00125 [Candidatus Saccharimonadales bacterium]|nr:hypothetical protein [Candidatus Saccharimonadales bacterium]